MERFGPPGTVRPALRAALLFALALVLAGCAGHEFKYSRMVCCRTPPVSESHAVRGDVSDSMRLLQESRLPHNTYRSRHDLVRASEHAAMTALGSEDYVLIGELAGHGNRQATFDTLVQAMNEKAAIQGGDALLVYSEEAGQPLYSVAVPMAAPPRGYAPGKGEYSFGNNGGTTLLLSKRTRIMRHPNARALVYKYVAGLEATHKRADALPDEELERTDKILADGLADPDMTLSEAIARWRAAVDGKPRRGRIND